VVKGGRSNREAREARAACLFRTVRLYIDTMVAVKEF
jgi:hypothetical protein